MTQLNGRCTGTSGTCAPTRLLVLLQGFGFRLMAWCLRLADGLCVNPLSTGQSKIGRRRPISLDYHCVNISQRISINKISLERSFHYLNADTLFLKIGQEMTLLQPFEVTQLIDFALDRSTSVTCGRDFAHSITMVTLKRLCIQQMTARIQAVDWRKNELHSCSTDEERLDFLFQFSEGDFLHSGLCILGV